MRKFKEELLEQEERHREEMRERESAENGLAGVQRERICMLKEEVGEERERAEREGMRREEAEQRGVEEGVRMRQWHAEEMSELSLRCEAAEAKAEAEAKAMLIAERADP